MNIEELYQQIVSSNWLYLVIAVITTAVIFIIVRTVQKSSLKHRIDQAQIKVNYLKSKNFGNDIAMADGIARVNLDFRDTALQSRKDFDSIQEQVKAAVSKLQDSSEDISTGNYKRCKAAITEAEQMLNEAGENAAKLGDVLQAVLNQSNIQRERINVLKSEFHNIKTIVNADSSDYIYCWEALDQLTNHISHLFTEFEQMMDASQYEDASVKSEEIDNSINSLNETISSLPTLIRLARTEIPESMNQLSANYRYVLENGPTLEHLGYDNIVIRINGILDDCLGKLKNCNIEGVNEQLLEVQGKVSSLLQDIDNEKNAYRQLQNAKSNCKDILSNIKQAIDEIEQDGGNAFQRYNLTTLQNDFTKLKAEYYSAKDSYQTMLETDRANSIPAVTLLSAFEEVEKGIVECKENCDKLCERMNECAIEEIRAKELISRFMVVLNESKAEIRLCHLPSISERFDHDIETAEQKIEYVSKALENNVLQMDEISTQINETQNEITSLYQHVNNLIDTAHDVEDFIIYCNRYRPYSTDVDSLLCSAELAFLNGDNTRACRLTAQALEKVDPKMARVLSNNIDRKLAANNEA